MNIKTKFDYGQKVNLDGDEDLVAYITSTSIRGNNTYYEVSWVINGRIEYFLVEEFRLKALQ